MTFRSQNRIIELEGENYVRGIVQSFNSIFQIIDGRNDQGNDVYVEFVAQNRAMNFGFFAQIKSGTSYKDSSGYKIPANQDHLQYWNRALYPMLGIVFDPELKKAFWIDIKEYISNNPEILHKDHHSIRVSASQEFSHASFENLRDDFMRQIQDYKSLQNFGQSLDFFASIDSPPICYEGFKSLYSNHRDKISTWFYILSAFDKIKEEGVRRNIIGVVSNYIDDPYIFWHAANLQFLPSSEMQVQIKRLLTQNFGIEAVKLCLPYLRDGVSTGSFPYLVYRVIDQIENAHLLFKTLAFEPGLEPDERNHIFWLYLHTAKHYSVDETLKTAAEYLSIYPFGFEDEALIGTKESIEGGDLSPIGH